MFLKYLSDYNYEERYWSFVFRFETLVGGIVVEAGKRVGDYTDEQASEFFREAFARVLDVDSGITPPDFWRNVEAPSLEWFSRYLNRELPYIIREARRLAADPNSQSGDSFDRSKAKRLAHESDSFRDFLLGDMPKPDNRD